MKTITFLTLLVSIFVFALPISAAKELPKVVVWDLTPRNTPTAHAQELTSILVSEISKLKKYEVYSQENVRTLAGWSAERMKLGSTDTHSLIVLGQMNVAKLISGSVGKIGDRYSISLNLFDTQNARAENAISEFCRSEDELIELVQQAIRILLGASLEPAAAMKKEVPETKQEKPVASAAPRTIHLGLVHHSQSPKMFTLDLPENFSRVEIGVYHEGSTAIDSYRGWNAGLKVNGKTVWEFKRWNQHEGGVITDYTRGGQEVREATGRGKYLDATSFFRPGMNQITFYHQNEGPGIHVQVRIQ